MCNLIKLLKTKKGRDETGLFIIEGEKFVNEIPADWQIIKYIISQSFDKKNSQYKNRADTEIIKDSIFNQLADTKNPQGILAVCKKQEYSLHEIITQNGFVLLGEELNDPGNTGTLIRTAAAAGARGIILTKLSCDPYNPKVLRAAAGAVFRLPIITDIEQTEAIKAIRQTHKIYAAHLGGETLPYSLNLKNNFCLMIGNEARGLSEAAVSQADTLVRLPMAEGTESLNACVAGSILMYEAVRQRML